jgi:hypothetical protein
VWGCRSADGCGKVASVVTRSITQVAEIRDARTLELVSQVPRSIVQDLFGVARFLDQGSARKFASSSQGAAADRGRVSH